VGDIIIEKGAEFVFDLGGALVIAIVKGGCSLGAACSVRKGIGTEVGAPEKEIFKARPWGMDEETFENLDWAKLRPEANEGISVCLDGAGQVIVVRPEDVPVVGRTGCVHVEFELGRPKVRCLVPAGYQQ
jgi:hypothetical protein